MHSEVFESLKGVKEVLSDNFTSSQLLGSLDILLFNAIDCIIEHTDWLDLVVGKVILWYGDNKKRKLSPIPKDDFLELCFLFLCSDTGGKQKIVRRLEMERNVWISSLKLFCHSTTSLDPLDPMRVAYKQKPNGDLWVANRDVTYWLDKALEMKKRIMEKYMRYTVTMARAYYKGSNTDIDLDDLIQNFILAVSKAIDKCSTNHGTLTAYIGQWMRSAQNSSASGHEYGVAYSVPHSLRKQFSVGRVPNIYVPMESAEVQSVTEEDTILEDESERLKIRLLAKHADPSGLARHYYGIAEELLEEELQLVKYVH